MKIKKYINSKRFIFIDFVIFLTCIMLVYIDIQKIVIPYYLVLLYPMVCILVIRIINVLKGFWNK